jgi:hypothetical protein
MSEPKDMDVNKTSLQEIVACIQTLHKFIDDPKQIFELPEEL